MTQQEEAFLARHGDIVVLSIIENWERSKGIKPNPAVSIMERWLRFLRETDYAGMSDMKAA
jgi:hypothetical protein